MTIRKRLVTSRRAKVAPIPATLTKRNLATRIGCKANLIDQILEEIAKHFANGGEAVSIRGFGRFQILKRKAFSTVHPRTGVPMSVAARSGITFKPSRDLMSRINS